MGRPYDGDVNGPLRESKHLETCTDSSPHDSLTVAAHEILAVGENRVATGAAADDVEVAIPGEEAVIALLAEESILSVAAVDSVVAAEPADAVRLRTSVYPVGAGAASQRAEWLPVEHFPETS